MQLSVAQTALNRTIDTVRERISKTYLDQLPDTHTVLPPVAAGNSRVRVLRISRLAYSNERITDRLISVYQSVSGLVETCFLMIQGRGMDVDLYLGIRSGAHSTAIETLSNSLRGNFPGIHAELLSDAAFAQVQDRIPDDKTPYAPNSVALISVVPTDRRADHRSDEDNVQGLEKFMDAMQGKHYTAVILAKPFSNADISARIQALEAIATNLTVLEQVTLQTSTSESDAVSDSIAKTISQSINTSLCYGYSSAYTANQSSQISFSRGGSFNPFLFAATRGIQFASASGNAQTNGVQETIQNAQGFQDSIAETLGTIKTVTSSESITKTLRNVQVTNLLQQLSQQIQRLYEGASYGLWDCCGYFIADSADIAVTAASQFKSLVTGTDTYVEQSVLSVWQPTIYSNHTNNYHSISNLIKSLKQGIPPQFAPIGTAGISHRTDSVVTGAELPWLMGLPKHSSGNVTVLQMARFGRNVHYLADQLPDPANLFQIGKVRHLGVTQQTPVFIDKTHLPGHMSVFGSTGSGKSRGVCGIVENLHRQHIPVTVIEPAKGDYCNIWRRLPGIRIYGTSPYKYQMLRLNPFAFHEQVHVLNHIERIISVFRVCWPLYAAQSAVLRDCVNRAYTKCGWDLSNSIYIGPDPVRFPTFNDVLDVLPQVIRESKFVGEAKGTYEGALQTRIAMLTDGLFGQLLNNAQDVSADELFDANVIIDLSELGSSEVLSLMMGTLLIKLYEYRMTCGASPLRHVTVLEEAHNILPRSVGSVNSDEGENVLSKSVELLTKCIAELRFTGEGFIIVDQSPSAVDLTAIRNTATKMIFRLNDRQDQAAAAAALSLDEHQQQELARLPVRNAIVMQDGWAEPVMTELNYFKSAWHDSTNVTLTAADAGKVRGFLAGLVLAQADTRQYDEQAFRSALDLIQGLDPWKKQSYLSIFSSFRSRGAALTGASTPGPVCWPFYGDLLTELLLCKGLFSVYPIPKPDKSLDRPYAHNAAYIRQCEQWKTNALRALSKYAQDLPTQQLDQILRLLLFAYAREERCCYLVITALYSK